MNYLLGTLALLGVGFIGFLIEIHKQDKHLITVFRELSDDQAGIIADQRIEIIRLEANQKPVPWNKGKKGYKLTRKPKESKESTFILTDAPFFVAYDKDGNETVSPSWEKIG